MTALFSLLDADTPNQTRSAIVQGISCNRTSRPVATDPRSLNWVGSDRATAEEVRRQERPSLVVVSNLEPDRFARIRRRIRVGLARLPPQIRVPGATTVIPPTSNRHVNRLRGEERDASRKLGLLTDRPFAARNRERVKMLFLGNRLLVTTRTRQQMDSCAPKFWPKAMFCRCEYRTEEYAAFHASLAAEDAHACCRCSSPAAKRGSYLER